MLPVEGSTIFTFLVLALGSGIFLRLVAKEIKRRERHLRIRLEEKIKEIEQEEQARCLAEAKATSDESDEIATTLEISEQAEAA